MKETLISFISKYRLDSRFYILGVILLIYVSLFVRIDGFSQPYLNQDGERDSLVASHIVSFGETPLNGPLGQVPNSPLYYYFLASILALNNSVMFLLVSNIFLQVFGLIFVYLLAEKLFGKQTAIVSLFLFSFSSIVLIQSRFLFQPHIMMPFINLSFLLLALAYLKKSYPILLLGVCMFIVAGTLHNAVFGLIPALILAVVLIHRKLQFGPKYYLLTFLTAVILFASFYWPLVVLYGDKISSYFLPSNSSLHIVGPLEFFPNLYERSKMFLKLFFGKTDVDWMIAAILIVVIGGFIFKKKGNRDAFSLFAIAVLQFLIATALFKTDFPFPDRYFTPIFGLFIILISDSIVTIFSKYKLLFPFKVLAVIFIYSLTTGVNLYSSLSTRFFPATASIFESMQSSKPGYSVNEPAGSIIVAVEKEILALQESENFEALDFFRFRSYLNGINYYPMEAPFWASLERDFQYQLTRVDDYDLRGYKPIGSDNYIFLICSISEAESCQNQFFAENRYSLVKWVASDTYYQVFLVKKSLNSI